MSRQDATTEILPNWLRGGRQMHQDGPGGALASKAGASPRPDDSHRVVSRYFSSMNSREEQAPVALLPVA